MKLLFSSYALLFAAWCASASVLSDDFDDLLRGIPGEFHDRLIEQVRRVEASSFPSLSSNPWLDRLKNAANEAKKYGWKNFSRWAFEPGKSTLYNGFEFIPVFTSDDAKGTNISCFRIPSVTQTADGTIVAFAEARGDFGIPETKTKGSCADCSPLGIAVKRSFDGGLTWVPKVGVEWAVHPSFAAGTHPANASHLGFTNSGGNPVAVYDSVKDRILLHFVRGEGGSNGDCVPGVSNWQTTSDDQGSTWSAPTDISRYLGDFVGSLPGPGRGGVQAADGRLIFNAHFGTAERGSGAVVVYYSDDHGETYSLAHSPPFPHMDESTMTYTNGEVIINMRNDPATSGCVPTSRAAQNGGDGVQPVPCHVRAVSRSRDNGKTWDPLSFDENLPDPVCEASLSTVANVTVYFNPTMQAMRSMPALRFSADGGRTWAKTIPVGDTFVDYSAIVNGALIKGPDADKGKVVGGVLWTSCTHPLPFRLWCTPIDQVKALDITFWDVGFTRFEVPSMKN